MQRTIANAAESSVLQGVGDDVSMAKGKHGFSQQADARRQATQAAGSKGRQSGSGRLFHLTKLTTLATEANAIALVASGLARFGLVPRFSAHVAMTTTASLSNTTARGQFGTGDSADRLTPTQIG